MAWIKVRTNLPEDIAVSKLATRMKVPTCHALGMCVRFWLWLDGNSTDGRVRGVSDAWINELVGHPAFVPALTVVGWLKRTKSGFIVPNYRRWLGDTAKSRLTAALERPAIPRPGRSDQTRPTQTTPHGVGGMSAARRRMDAIIGA